MSESDDWFLPGRKNHKYRQISNNLQKYIKQISIAKFKIMQNRLLITRLVFGEATRSLSS